MCPRNDDDDWDNDENDKPKESAVEIQARIKKQAAAQAAQFGSNKAGAAVQGTKKTPDDVKQQHLKASIIEALQAELKDRQSKSASQKLLQEIENNDKKIQALQQAVLQKQSAEQDPNIPEAPPAPPGGPPVFEPPMASATPKMTKPISQDDKRIEDLIKEIKALNALENEAVLKALQAKRDAQLELLKALTPQQSVKSVEPESQATAQKPSGSPLLAQIQGGMQLKKVKPISGAKPKTVDNADPFADITKRRAAIEIEDEDDIGDAFEDDVPAKKSKEELRAELLKEQNIKLDADKKDIEAQLQKITETIESLKQQQQEAVARTVKQPTPKQAQAEVVPQPVVSTQQTQAEVVPQQPVVSTQKVEAGKTDIKPEPQSSFFGPQSVTARTSVVIPPVNDANVDEKQALTGILTKLLAETVKHRNNRTTSATLDTAKKGKFTANKDRIILHAIAREDYLKNLLAQVNSGVSLDSIKTEFLQKIKEDINNDKADHGFFSKKGRVYSMLKEAQDKLESPEPPKPKGKSTPNNQN